MNREAIFQALFDHVKTLPGFALASRRFRSWTEVDKADQPALLLLEGDHIPGNSADGEPTTWRLIAEVVVYAHSSDPDIPPSSILNPLLDAIEARLKSPIPGRPQTLGGVVERVWISGPIETSGDLMGDQGVASIPIEMLVTT